MPYLTVMRVVAEGEAEEVHARYRPDRCRLLRPCADLYYYLNYGAQDRHTPAITPKKTLALFEIFKRLINPAGRPRTIPELSCEPCKRRLLPFFGEVWAWIAEAGHRFPGRILTSAFFARRNRSMRFLRQIWRLVISLLSTGSGNSIISGAVPEMPVEFQKMF